MEYSNLQYFDCRDTELKRIFFNISIEGNILDLKDINYFNFNYSYNSTENSITRKYVLIDRNNKL